MADQYTRFLTGAAAGILNPKGNLGDFRHASKIFIDGGMAHVPRTKFSFYVNFEVNQPALQSGVYTFTSERIGMFVKQSDLPKVTLEHDVKNQYNRKKVIYKDLKYEPLNLTFHDDSMGKVNALWAQYLSYYSPERLQPIQAWANTSTGPYSKQSIGAGNYKYGLDRTRGVKADKDAAGTAFYKPFFNHITIYTMSKKRFQSYILVNPHIVSWNHGNVDYASSNGTVDAQMGIVYESVLYGAGAIIKGKEPDNFGMYMYYDVTPSPLTVGGGTVTGLFGPGGLINAATPLLGELNDNQAIYGDYYQGGSDSRSGNFFKNAVTAINIYKSLRTITKENLVAEATNLILTPGAAVNAVSGLPGIAFGSRN